jgi:hypothetical protein
MVYVIRYTRFVGVGDSKFSTIEKLEECQGYGITCAYHSIVAHIHVICCVDVVEDTITFGIRLKVAELLEKVGGTQSGPSWMDNIEQHTHLLDE